MFSILFINLLTKSINVNSVQECPTSVEHGHLFFLQSLTTVEVFIFALFLGQGHTFGSVLLSTHYFILLHVIDFFHGGNSVYYCLSLIWGLTVQLAVSRLTTD